MSEIPSPKIGDIALFSLLRAQEKAGQGTQHTYATCYVRDLDTDATLEATDGYNMKIYTPEQAEVMIKEYQERYPDAVVVSRNCEFRGYAQRTEAFRTKDTPPKEGPKPQPKHVEAHELSRQLLTATR